MKKLFILVLALCIALVANTNIVFAVTSLDKIEIISKETPTKPIEKEKNWWTGKEFTKQTFDKTKIEYKRYISGDGIHFTDTGLPSSLASKDTLLWFNGVYILLDCNSFVPDRYFNQNGYTSPYYILNEDFNVLKEVEYPGRIIRCCVENGVFYYITQERIKDEVYGSNLTGSSFEYIFNKTSDFVNITKSTIDINTLDNVFPTYTNIFKKDVVYEVEKFKNPFVGYNIYSRYGMYSFDGIYYYDLHSICEKQLEVGVYGWYKDGFLYVEEENDYLKIQVDKPNNVYIELNGKILAFEKPPVVEEDRTLVPMRFLFECLGDTVTWDEETQTVTASNGENTVVFAIDSCNAEVNGSTQTMDVPARLIGDKTYVPLRFLSENLGYTVT